MFAIRILPSSQRGPDGERLGEIRIGTFAERFACSGVEPAEELEAKWRSQLRLLLQGESKVALVHDPRFAWIVYRIGNDCHVQQHLYVEGTFESLPNRCTVNEDGERISEWKTNTAEIEQFLGVCQS